MALQAQAGELTMSIPVALYHPAIAWVTMGAVSGCSLFLLMAML